MTTPEIRDALDRAISYLRDHPTDAKYTDSPATAVLTDSLRVTVTGPGGATLTTDMPKSIGGYGELASPGWFLRAAQASCLASLIGMEAAKVGAAIRHVVTVDSESDDYGILGIDDAVPAGPLVSRARVRLDIDPPADVQVLIKSADSHCPVTDAVRRAVQWTVEII